MKIEILYSEFCNLYGDNGNINYLIQAIKNVHKDAEIIYTSINDEIKFISEKVDLVYIGSLSETKFNLVLCKLKEKRKEIINKINEGQLIIATGNAFDLFGEYVILDRRYINKNFVTSKENKTTLEYYNAVTYDEKGHIKNIDLDKIEEKYKIKCLGLYNTIAVTNMLLRYNSYTLAKLKNNIYLVGFKNSFTQSYIKDEELSNNNLDFNTSETSIEYLAKVMRGSGNSENDVNEGIRINNFIATYLLGPLFVLNPEFTRYIFNQLLEIPGEIYLEKQLKEAYQTRLIEFEDDKRDIGIWHEKIERPIEHRN